MPDRELTRRRSCLSVPASADAMVAKAPCRGADEVILDLEDAVVPAAKDAARERACSALSAWTSGVVAVRVNAPRTPWCHQDLIALARTDRPLSVIVPKVETPGDLHFVERLLDGAEAGRRTPIRVQALIETAAGIANVDAIARAGARLEALILGYADLAASLGRGRDAAAAPDRWIYAQDRLLVAARTSGLQAIDGPYLGTAADDAFVASATHARVLGFDGKWAIHPAQVPHLNTLFLPTDAEVEHARRVLDALERSEAGATDLDGEMVDEAMRVAALRVLARAERV